MNRKAISAGLFVAMAAVGCGQKTDIVFNIAKKPATADGRTVIEIKPNGKPRPAGVGPGGNYLLLVRKNGEAFYARQFDATEAASGVVRDLAMR
ncbi:MAG TPA: hypothetical protein VNC50_02390, partial [Planctomycetia bacterium]|nr:hypothetical protein [Planctomycetia bacterium]